jgi:hypothetical protein
MSGSASRFEGSAIEEWPCRVVGYGWKFYKLTDYYTWMEKLYISLDDLGSIIEPTVPESLVDRIMQA